MITRMYPKMKKREKLEFQLMIYLMQFSFLEEALLDGLS